ncbi:MAG: M13 family peptidase [Comamonadaceae bacterium]|nr:MAG: M13 family peptidase [Comamonadaceae bacterium]
MQFRDRHFKVGTPAFLRVLPLAFALACALLLGGCNLDDEPASAQVQASGVEKTNMDAAVRPQDDFYQYVNGKWLATTDIPADKPGWGAFQELDRTVETQLLAIIQETGSKPAPSADAPTAQQADEPKISALYQSFMNEAELEKRGTAPLQPLIQAIAAINDKRALSALLGRAPALGLNAPFRIQIGQDARDPSRYAAYLTQAGLGLPDRDYYLDADKADLLARYRQHIATMFTLASDPALAARADDIVALEKKLAQIQWSARDNQDPVKTYNKTPVAELPRLAASVDWEAYLRDAGVTERADHVIVQQPTYLRSFDAVFAQTPLATWKAYFQWQALSSSASYLSAPLAHEDFAFFSGALRGLQENVPRPRRGLALVNAAMGDSLGRLYVERHFPADRKARMQALVEKLLVASKQSLDAAAWLSAKTRQEAQAKLAKFNVKIGYPARWKDYTKLEISKDDLLGNVQRAWAFEYQHSLGKLGQPVDRDEWGLTPQTINAYYNPGLNEIVFPAAILQPPFFNADAEDAINYGAIGAIIGHEISHGFDDQGSQFDGDGQLRDWWTADDKASFAARTQKLVSQYGRLSPLPGYLVNGELTLGENIADNAGLSIAWRAWNLSLAGGPSPVLDGFTGGERFYIGYAQAFRAKFRDAEQLRYLKVDPHAPARFRINGNLPNQAGFYETYDLKTTDRMYLVPADRVSIW